MFTLFILLLFLPDSLDTHPLQKDSDSSTRRSENLLLTTASVNDPVSALLGDFNDVATLTHCTLRGDCMKGTSKT
ncbi:hypothetical protein OSTOST_23789 [Ostertagia ostertagi]